MTQEFRNPGPVVSIGALSFGGAGKTPFTRYLAQRLQDMGVPVAILLKSYRGSTTLPAPVESVSWPDLLAFGDEPLVMRRGLSPDVGIWAGPHKSRLLKAFREKYPHKLVLIDDGAAHGPLRKVPQIFIINASQYPWNRFMVPFGINRLPVWDLRRAFQVVVTRLHQLDDSQKKSFHQWLRRHIPQGIPVYECDMLTVWPKTDRPLMMVTSIAEGPGLAQQARFFFGQQLIKVMHLRNHQLPTEVVWNKMKEFLRCYPDGQFLLTEKDYVKWVHLFEPEKLALVELKVELLNEFQFWSDWAKNPFLASVGIPLEALSPPSST